MSIKACGVCEGPIELPDGHDSCVFCLGHAHAEAADIESNCPHCGEMSVRALRTRIAILLNEQPILSSQQSPSASYAEPWKTKSRRPEVETGRATGEHMSVHPPTCLPLSFHHTMKPLALYAEKWRALPSTSRWVMSIIEKGYTLQFARRPPHFNGVVMSAVQTQNASFLRAEIHSLLEKGAIEVVHPEERESGFYSCYFMGSKKDSGLRPILDLRQLNQALATRSFRMITLKQSLSLIRPGDWFASIDLKDAYFHIQIAPPTQARSEICIRGSCIPVYSPSVWLVPGATHVYEMYERHSLPSTSERSACSKLSGRLAADGSFRERARCSQVYAYQPPAVFGAYNQFSKTQTPTHAMHFIPGREPLLSLYAGPPAPGTHTDDYEFTRGVPGREVTPLKRFQRALGLMTRQYVAWVCSTCALSSFG